MNVDFRILLGLYCMYLCVSWYRETEDFTKKRLYIIELIAAIYYVFLQIQNKFHIFSGDSVMVWFIDKSIPIYFIIVLSTAVAIGRHDVDENSDLSSEEKERKKKIGTYGILFFGGFLFWMYVDSFYNNSNMFDAIYNLFDSGR